MDLMLIRHTRVAVKKGICYGFSDVDLAESFNNEFESVSKQITNKKFDIVYSSPLSRCKNLAEKLFPNQYINFDKRLKELNFGDWEGLDWDNIYKTKEAKLFFEDYINTKCPAGESYEDLTTRVEDFYQEISKIHIDKKVAIICHGGTIRAFLCVIEGIYPKEAFERKIEYGEIIQIKK